MARERERGPARRLRRVPAVATARWCGRAGPGPRLCALRPIELAQERRGAGRDLARATASRRARARHRGRRFRAARPPSRAGRGRGCQSDSARAGARPGARVAPGKDELSVPEAQLVASGNWGGAGPQRMAMDFRLVLADSGALLQRLGVGQGIRGGKGELSGNVAWTGSPLSPDYPSMAGQINVAIESGQFLKAEPGAARLLSVLSLQSLPRRLAFDFRDLFEEGFAFDSVTGDISIDRGRGAHQQPAHARPAAPRADGRQRRHRAARRRTCVSWSCRRSMPAPRRSPYAIINPAVGMGTFLAQYLPAQADHRGRHARVPRHRRLERSEARARRAHARADPVGRRTARERRLGRSPSMRTA